jgi:hypothetical protein
MPADADPHPQSWVPLPTDETFAMRYDVSAGAERAVVQGFPEWLADVADSGALPAGAWCVGFDNALGSTVAVALASDERIVTSHMHVEIVRAPSPGDDRVPGHRNARVEGIRQRVHPRDDDVGW